jgi:ADP-ribosylglycohydrolase
MSDNAEAMVLASFAADSLALGAHWIYDTNRIDTELGRVDDLKTPPPDTYHPTKARGDFTHYGDQALTLLESVAASGGFDLTHFAQAWQALFGSYTGYRDRATTETLANFEAGRPPEASGSESADLGGASRIAPLVFRYRDDLDTLVDAARAQTAMTHNNPQVIRAAEFLSRVAWMVLGGASPGAAIRETFEDGFSRGDFGASIREGLDSVGKETRQVILGFGQHCGTPAALPVVIHLAVSYESDLETALVENVMAGGDSAARGMVAGMILGAHLGTAAIPGDWLSGLKARDRILALLGETG